MKYTLLRHITASTGTLAVLGLSLAFSNANAAEFTLPPSNDALLGKIQYTSPSMRDTPATIAQRYNLGVNAIVAANPGTTANSLGGKSTIKVATEFLLPPLPRKGIVVNLPEMRMYYYPEGTNEVLTYPIGIGRVGKMIPITNTAITRKTTNPTWTPPDDVREYNKQKGVELPDVMPAGPDNPLGNYAIYLKVPTFLIHSTIYPESIGTRASFGCIRMNETDIIAFYPIVKPGTTVAIIDMPNKIGWEGNALFLEAHPPLEEYATTHNINELVETVEASIPKGRVALVNWTLLSYLDEQPDGVPHKVGMIIR